jgi:hypothetical protein
VGVSIGEPLLEGTWIGKAFQSTPIHFNVHVVSFLNVSACVHWLAVPWMMCSPGTRLGMHTTAGTTYLAAATVVKVDVGGMIHTAVVAKDCWLAQEGGCMARREVLGTNWQPIGHYQLDNRARNCCEPLRCIMWAVVIPAPCAVSVVGTAFASQGTILECTRTWGHALPMAVLGRKWMSKKPEAELRVDAAVSRTQHLRLKCGQSVPRLQGRAVTADHRSLCPALQSSIQCRTLCP